jgi:cytochrome c biogenesis protein CcmG/thiol:disulfide interchange protein DsbE
MRRYCVLWVAVLVSVATGKGIAQTQGAKLGVVPPTVKLGEAQKAFDEIVQRFEKRLLESGAFTFDVISQWKSTGVGEDRKGTNIFHVAVQAGGKLRIEAGSKERGEAQLVCVSNGRTITRLLRSEVYSQHDAGTTLDELQHDAMTIQALEGSGVDVLVSPQFRARLIAQLEGNVEDLGLEKVDNVDMRHFRGVVREGERVFDMWFTTGNQPVLTRLVMTINMQIDGQQTFRLTTAGSFQWKIGVTHPEGTFTLAIPAGARRVHDLMAALQGDDIEQLVGKPAPPLALESLQGTKVNLADQLGKRVVVLIFWASWCAPSSDLMASVNEFVASCEKGGAAVYAVNLGENRDRVNNAVTEYGYKGTVLLDPDEESLRNYRIWQVPTTFLIGADGTVQAYQSGSTEEARGQIRAHAAALMSGKSLVPKGS